MHRIEISPRKLPAMMSGLIDVALDDLELAEASRLYEVDMYEWHTPQGPAEKCEICFAGGVIAFTLEGDINERLVPSSFDQATSKKLMALDDIRTGHVLWALRSIGAELPEGMASHVGIPDYRTDPVQFKARLRDLADELRAHNL